ncbi:hypothetical protein [Gordonia aichiensis]|uniref:Uncharacterized protein n=1 Tax=Gordonia aichiensis NBRC 108223 TaxID=1220583 RepID=L7KFS3_9ACTN|nr:hypothetical protein GOACH_03_03640 [Gordonia aichiensis NBRC 108223]
MSSPPPASDGVHPAPDVPALANMSIQDMIDATPLGPILDRPVGDVLAGLGLPQIPQFPALPPMPGLPPLPTIDVGLLLQPITDLLGGFGTGDLSGAAIDPSMVFSGLSTVLDTAMSSAAEALSALDALWAGQASTGATTKTAQASVDSAALSTQGGVMSIDIQAAAGIVAAGLATVQGIIAATIGKIAVLGPGLVTPIGQSVAVGFAAEGLAEATAAVAVTRAQLLGPTTQMVVNGAPVNVTSPPTAATSAAQSSFALASSILGAVSPLVSTAAQLPSALLNPVSDMLGTESITDGEAVRGEHLVGGDGPESSGPGGGSGDARVAAASAGGLGAGGLGVGVGTGSVPLGAARPGMPAPGATEPASLTPSQTTRTPAATTTPVPASMAPMMAAGAARGAGEAAEHHEIPDYLITEEHGQQVVGDSRTVAPSVIGAHTVEPEPAPTPDIELRLRWDESVHESTGPQR